MRYVGCSNYSGWQLMKALGVSERLGLQRYATECPVWSHTTAFVAVVEESMPMTYVGELI